MDEAEAEYWAARDAMRAANQRLAAALKALGGKKPILAPDPERQERGWAKLAAAPECKPSRAMRLRPMRPDLSTYCGWVSDDWAGIELPTRVWMVLGSLNVKTPKDLLALDHEDVLNAENAGLVVAGFIARLRARVATETLDLLPAAGAESR